MASGPSSPPCDPPDPDPATDHPRHLPRLPRLDLQPPPPSPCPTHGTTPAASRPPATITTIPKRAPWGAAADGWAGWLPRRRVVIVVAGGDGGAAAPRSPLAAPATTTTTRLRDGPLAHPKPRPPKLPAPLPQRQVMPGEPRRGGGGGWLWWGLVAAQRAGSDGRAGGSGGLRGGLDGSWAVGFHPTACTGVLKLYSLYDRTMHSSFSPKNIEYAFYTFGVGCTHV